MIILTMHDGHNASAALMINGKIELAVQEERFNQIKNFTGYPYQSIKYCLKFLKKKNLKINKAGITSVFNNPYGNKIKMFNNFRPEDFINWWRTKVEFNYFDEKKKSKNFFSQNNSKRRSKFTIEYLSKIKNKYKNKPEYYNFNFLNSKNIHKPNVEALKFKEERLRLFSNQIGINKKDIEFIDHHSCHAYYGYFSSDLNGKKALVSTIDGGGDGLKQTMWKSDGKNLILISKNNSCPLGKYWKIICVLLSLKPMEHEYKVMGLAPYSKEKYSNEVFKELKKLSYVKNFDILENFFLSKSDNTYDYLRRKFINFRFDAIAGGIQKFTEYLVVKLITSSLKKTKLVNFVGSGGLYMNVKLNKSISEIKNLKKIFISGSAGDESLPMGGCYFLNKKNKSFKLDNLYVGFKEEKIDLSKYKKNYKILKIKNNKVIIEKILEGKIIGLFNDRAEFGARALGNRSIIARPDQTDIVKKINEAVKNRDFWMPFAITLLKNKQHDYIINKKLINSPHMTIAFDTKLKNLNLIKSGTHFYDNTVRPQILEKKFNEKYFNLLMDVYKATKIPALLNTSLNLHGKPLVNSISDAFRTFKNSDLDYLVIDYKYLISKKN